MEELTTIGNWLNDNEAAISAVAGLLAIVVVLFVPVRGLWRRFRGSADSPAHTSTTEPASGSTRPSILILPFDDLSEGVIAAGAVDGFTEDLTALTARMAGYHVLARNTAFAYKGQSPNVQDLGRELSVRYVVEGSIRPLGDKVRVTVQLIETESGTHLWAGKFERPLASVTGALDELTETIARVLGGELTQAEAARANRAAPEELGAWEYYQLAKSTLMSQGWSESSFTEVARLARKAIEADPDFAPPRAYLALILAIGHWVQLVPDRQAAHDESLACAEAALDLAPGSSEVLGYAGCAFCDLGYSQKGVPIIERAIELDPTNAQAFAALGAAKIMTGELEEGIRRLEHAIELSPKDPGYAPWSTLLSFAAAMLGDQVKSLHWARSACQSDARYFPSQIAYARALAHEGKSREAQKAIAEARRLFPALDRDYVIGFMGEWVCKDLEQADIALS